MEGIFCTNCGFRPLPEVDLPPSPIPSLLNTNAVPTAREAQLIQDSLGRAHRDLQHLETRISHFQSILTSLHREKERLESFMTDHRAFLTPARRLYPDILSEIFSHCSRGSTRKRLSEIPDSFDPKQGPLLLTQVCRTWRNVAIWTPQLWTTVRFVLNGSSESQRELVKLWLERSGACKLTISVMDAKDLSETAPGLAESHQAALRSLCAASDRWESACFVLPPVESYWAPLASVRGNTPNLRNLTIHVSRSRWAQDFALPVFSDAPQLTRLSLDYKTVVPQLQLDPRRITHFSYQMHRQTPIPIIMCLESMRHLPNLRQCTLHCGSFEPLLYPHVAEVSMPHLQHLRVIAEPLREGLRTVGLGGLFKSLHLPALQSLEIASNGLIREWDQWPLLNCISRSPHLSALSIAWENVRPEQLAEVLYQAPALTDLQLAASGTILVPLLHSLAVAQTPTLLPKLAHVDVVETGRSLVTKSSQVVVAFTEMVERRMWFPVSEKQAPLCTARATVDDIPDRAPTTVGKATMPLGISVQSTERTVIYHRYITQVK